ncbi:UNVERIFIED_CONTAM: hypothetical protein RMT77_001680 [Armadillidium vulgare]
MSGSRRSVIDILKNYDAYPKTLEDFQIKTFSGAAVTMVAFALMGILFMSELYDYLSPNISEDLLVDTTRGSKLRINIDFVFPSIPCEMLSIDAMDLSGEQHINIQHNLYKRRLDMYGKPMQDPERQTEIGHGNKKFLDAVLPNATSTIKPECESCYGAEYGDVKCCNTCEEVKEAYRKKGWALPPLADIAQCKREGILTETKDLPKEGCQLYGYLDVNRVGGNFHIAPGKSYQHSHLHIHDVQQYRMSDFDLSHRIRHLSFGQNVPGKTDPMDGFEYKTEKGAKTINYYIKIVPTTFQRRDESLLMTNQFSVTQHEKKFNMMLGDQSLPGVFFSYELSPMMVKYTEKSRSLGHFLTGLCSIIGGIYTVAGLIDAAIYHSVRALQKKVDLGKAG